MTEVFFSLIAIIFFANIIRTTGVRRLCWFITGLLFFPNQIIVISYPVSIPFHRLLVYSLLISELINYRSFINNFRKFPLKKITIILYISHILTGVFDERLNVFLKFYRPTFNFIETYFIIFLSYVSINSKSDETKIIKTILSSSICLCLYGIYNYITESNPYDYLINDVYNSRSFFQQFLAHEGRFRINSFIFHPITYGYIISIFIILLLSTPKDFTTKYKNYYVVTFIMLLINLFLTNSRTPIFVLCFGFVLHTILINKTSKIFKIITNAGIVCSLIYTFFTPIREKMDSVIDIFETGGVKTAGSNVEMRTTQFALSYTIFLKKPVWGNGFGYITEDLGYSSESDERTSDEELYGFESYIYKLLIEQGAFQIIIIIIFISVLLYYFYVNKRFDRKHSSLGTTFLLMFIIFSLATGVLGTWIISMTLIGIQIKLIESQKLNKT